jgi:predicted tellurium resistance membrane protein TerC
MTDFFDLFLHSSTYISLLTLTLMEIVLGIDNVIFISIVASKLPKALQPKARYLGLTAALVIRVLLLFTISWIIGLTKPLVTIGEFGVTGRDLILLGGGLFLMAKSTMEIHHKFEGDSENASVQAGISFSSVVWQIILLDVVFSFDSVITAVGLVDQVAIMVIAVIISMLIMLAFAGSVSAFVEKHPTVKMLALSFLLMIGMVLIAEGMHFHVPKGYVYFAMAFSMFVELLNLKMHKNKNAR